MSALRKRPLVCPEQELLEQTQAFLEQKRNNGKRPSRKLQAVWDHFYETYDARIRRFAVTCHVSGDDLVDCVQEVWRTLLERLPTFHLDPERGKFDTWLFAIVRSKAANLLRTRQQQPPALDNALVETPEENADLFTRQENREFLTRVLQQVQDGLSPENYQILKLRLIDNRPVPEVAEKLGLSNEQVWYRYHRARHLLKEISDGILHDPHTTQHLNQSDPNQKHAPQYLHKTAPKKPATQHVTETAPRKKQISEKTAQGNSANSVSRENGQSSFLFQGGHVVDFVFKKLELGRQGNNTEWKVEWECNGSPSALLYIRKLSMVAYAEICGPEETLNNHWPQITSAAINAGVAAGIATIIATPTAALPIFRAEFAKQLGTKVAREVGENIYVALSARQEPNGPWCECKE